jgi:hypothetical protein
MKPGNAGGGKDPDFWNAFENGEDRVIGDEPGNTAQDEDLSEEALSQGEGMPMSWPAPMREHRAWTG